MLTEAEKVILQGSSPAGEGGDVDEDSEATKDFKDTMPSAKFEVEHGQGGDLLTEAEKVILQACSHVGADLDLVGQDLDG